MSLSKGKLGLQRLRRVRVNLSLSLSSECLLALEKKRNSLGPHEIL